MVLFTLKTRGAKILEHEVMSRNQPFKYLCEHANAVLDEETVELI